jgi:2-polyprenyl-6-methoxyphenol hydroxylase-like FAD-dependent oxidoreductase
MPKELTTDVLICGAGAAGLTLAIDLARRGVSFRLIDKMDGPFQGSRGKGIQPRTQEIFEDLGIVDRIVATGGLYPPQREYREDGSFTESDIMELVDPTPAEPYHVALMVPQFLTEGVIRERLIELGHEVEFGCELVGLEHDEGGVTARLAGKAGEEVVRVRYLVGANGGRSFVRHALNIGFPGKTLGVRAVVADVLLTGLERTAWHRFHEGAMDRQMSLCPLAGTELFQLQAPIPLLETQRRLARGRSRTGRANPRRRGSGDALVRIVQGAALDAAWLRGRARRCAATPEPPYPRLRSTRRSCRRGRLLPRRICRLARRLGACPS